MAVYLVDYRSPSAAAAWRRWLSSQAVSDSSQVLTGTADSITSRVAIRPLSVGLALVAPRQFALTRLERVCRCLYLLLLPFHWLQLTVFSSYWIALFWGSYERRKALGPDVLSWMTLNGLGDDAQSTWLFTISTIPLLIIAIFDFGPFGMRVRKRESELRHSLKTHGVATSTVTSTKQPLVFPGELALAILPYTWFLFRYFEYVSRLEYGESLLDIINDIYGNNVISYIQVVLVFYVITFTLSRFAHARLLRYQDLESYWKLSMTPLLRSVTEMFIFEMLVYIFLLVMILAWYMDPSDRLASTVIIFRWMIVRRDLFVLTGIIFTLTLLLVLSFRIWNLARCWNDASCPIEYCGQNQVGNISSKFSKILVAVEWVTYSITSAVALVSALSIIFAVILHSNIVADNEGVYRNTTADFMWSWLREYQGSFVAIPVFYTEETRSLMAHYLNITGIFSTEITTWDVSPIVIMIFFLPLFTWFGLWVYSNVSGAIGAIILLSTLR